MGDELPQGHPSEPIPDGPFYIAHQGMGGSDELDARFLGRVYPFLIGWGVGVFCIVIVLDSRHRVVRLLVLGLVVYIGAQVLIAVLPTGSGFQTRLLELSQPPETFRAYGL